MPKGEEIQSGFELEVGAMTCFLQGRQLTSPRVVFDENERRKNLRAGLRAPHR
jgi:hypothetical protein